MQHPGVASHRTECLKVLSVSQIEDDHLSLQTIFEHTTWKLFKADYYDAALSILRHHDIAVVLCERDLQRGKWTDLLAYITDLPQPPSMIVTSRFADERLWAEALNFGAWDVLAKPFERDEVLRSVKAAWQHWYDQTKVPVGAEKVMRAAS